LTAALLLIGSGSRAQNSATSEARLKAAFLFNFAKFVEWPAESFAERTSPFIIGVLDNSEFAGELEKTVLAKKIDEHPINVRLFRTAADIGDCHILFVTAENKRPSEVIRRLEGKPILTVGESERFLEAGGMITFLSENQKIRFQINHEVAKAARLSVSSKLLSLAVRAP
jgi:hypothetical protein